MESRDTINAALARIIYTTPIELIDEWHRRYRKMHGNVLATFVRDKNPLLWIDSTSLSCVVIDEGGTIPDAAWTGLDPAAVSVPEPFVPSFADLQRGARAVLDMDHKGMNVT